MKRSSLATLAMLVALGACQRQESGSSNRSAAETADVVAHGTVSPTSGPITEQGLGPLRIGMTVDQARAVFPVIELRGGGSGGGCTYAIIPGLPNGVSVMVENGLVVRLDVDSNGVATREGARVGDSEARVRALYGARLTISPHKYTDGHYLTVRSAGDSLHRIVFETDKGKVTTYRVGLIPPVEYVERCS